VASPATPAPGSASPDAGQSFDSSLRGYDRRQVDEFLVGLQREVTRLRADAEEAQRGRRAAAEHAESIEAELRELKSRSASSEPKSIEDSFGYRAEKLLRMAENEAIETRQSASRESAAMIEQARTEAEKHRHEVEQTLISRASLLEQQAAQRAAELQEREQQISAQLATAREQADQMHAAAARAAERLRADSEAAAADTRQRAAADAQRMRDQATQEINRLTTVQSDVRAELGRLAEVLASELGGRSAQGAVPAGESRAEVPEQAGAPRKVEATAGAS
jgi:cell division septum initiation protein DivIVA